MSTQRSIISLLLFVGLLFGAGPVAAQLFGESHTKAELLIAESQVVPGSEVKGVFRLTMDEHWHTYWKNPGDVGLPTEVKWTLPPGWSAGELQFPAPKFIETAGLVSFAYEDQVLLPFTLQVPDSAKAGESVELKADLTWLECEEACVPGEATLSQSLTVSESPEAGPEKSVVESGFEAIPPKSEAVEAFRQGSDISLTIPPEFNPEKTRFFPDTPGQISYTAPQSLTNEGDAERLLLKPDDTAETPVDYVSGVLSDGTRAVQFKAELKRPSLVKPQAGLLTIALSSAAAFVGGMILNLMPCVFPVLSLKVLGIVEQSNSEGRPAWHHGVVFGLGVLLSFWVMSGILLAVRAAGQGVGWGYHLQNPLMIAGLSVLFLLIALNLFGLFEVGENLTQLSGVAEKKEGFAHSFWSGVLTTLAATPCTAPFMGGAVGFALSQPAWVAFLIFSALALGIAAPYFLLTLFPRLLKKLPKPGAWMVTFKQVLAFPMLLAVVWLVWVFGGQVGTDRMALLLLGLVGVAFAAWVYGTWGSSFEPKTQKMGTFFAALAMMGALYTGYTATQEPPGAELWLDYSPVLVDELKESGKPFFLDFTADWCTSCKANELVALSRDDVLQKFKDLDVTLVKADWTNEDPVITEALEEYGRAGVPLYVLYPGNGKEPKILPEVLLPGTVLEALESVES